MFQFRRFPTYAYFIQRRLTEYCSAGFPHSVIPGSTLMCSSPRLIAACHDLLRLLMPRHSPCALFSLTSSAWTSYPSLPPAGESSLTPSRLLFLADPLAPGSARRKVREFWFSQNYAGINRSSCLAHCFTQFLKLHNLLCPLLLALILHSALFSFQGASLPASFKARSKHPVPWVLRSGFDLVEIVGLEPTTPCLQSRCSPS